MRVWVLFWQLERRGRTGNGYSALPICNREVEAFLRLRGEVIEAWEMDLLDRMESERLAMLNEDPKKDKLSSTPLSPQLIQDLFSGKASK